MDSFYGITSSSTDQDDVRLIPFPTNVKDDDVIFGNNVTARKVREVLQCIIIGGSSPSAFLTNDDFRQAFVECKKEMPHYNTDSPKYGILSIYTRMILYPEHEPKDVSDAEKEFRAFYNVIVRQRTAMSDSQKIEIRNKLVNFLMIVARVTSSFALREVQGDGSCGPQGICVQQFVRLLLETILPVNYGGSKYQTLCSDICRRNVEADDDDDDKYRLKAAQLIIQEIVGDHPRVRAVVEYQHGSLVAKKNGDPRNPAFLPAELNEWAQNNWATTEPDVKSNTLSDVFLEFLGSGVLPYEATGSIMTNDDGVRVELERGVVKNAMKFLKAATELGQILPRREVDAIVDKLKVALGQPDSPAPLIEEECSYSSFQEDSQQYGSLSGGFSPAGKAIFFCIQQMKVDKRAKPLLIDYFKKEMDETWDEKIDPPPKSDEEVALCGRKYSDSDFEVLGVLGGGTFGRVFLLRQRRNPANRLALKVVSFTLTEWNTQFLNEILSGTKVKSLHIIRYLGFFPIYGICNPKRPLTFGIMMEECAHSLKFEVGRLQDLDPRSRLIESLNIIYQVLTGVYQLHKSSIYHRDIKPGNICLKLDGFYALIDFGLCKEKADGTLSTDFVGTPGYIPPNGAKTYTHDEYSTGKVFYDLMTGGDYCENPHALTSLELLRGFEIETVPAGNLAVDLFLQLVDPINKTRITAEKTLPKFAEIGQLLNVCFPFPKR